MLKAACFLYVLAVAGGADITTVTEPTEPTNPPESNDGLVILKTQAKRTCAAAAVTPDAEYLVTAAHCVYGASGSGLSVLSGDKSTTVKRVIIHPYYLPPSVDYDIALIRTNKIEGLKALKLARAAVPANALLTAFSWREETGLKSVSGALEDRKSCREKLASHIYVSSRMICANIQSDLVANGSPLIADAKIIGVGSYYVKGSKENMPKVFANIANSEIYSFIDRYI